ncbi:MAG: cadherin-like domain-containing protein [Thermoplasmata archaeon]|nr:cadherin-like domain-containing protein [Thermoplasmata archaeon]
MTEGRKPNDGTCARNRAKTVAGAMVLLLAVSLFSMPYGLTTESLAESVPSHERMFHLHEGNVSSESDYDWLNSSAVYDHSTLDYDGDSYLGISIRKNLPSQRWRHFWVLYPEVNADVQIQGDLSAHIWAASQGNESGSRMTVVYSDMAPADWYDPGAWAEIASATEPLIGPDYSTFKPYDVVAPGVDYVLPAGHHLVITIIRGDSINDRLLVLYDDDDFDSYILMDTSTFISVDEVTTTDSLGSARQVFSDEEEITVRANISNPFGTYEMLDAEVEIAYYTNGTPVVGPTQMTLYEEDTSSNPSWKVYAYAFGSLPNATLVVTVYAVDPQGSPSWMNATITIVAVDHFSIAVPETVTVMEPFVVTVLALDADDEIVTEWLGTVQLEALMPDGITPATGGLGIGFITIASDDFGQKTITDQTCDYSEETIVIRAFSGSHQGFSAEFDVRSGAVVDIVLTPEGPLTVSAGTAVAFAAEGIDSLGMINSTWTPVWTMTGALGTLLADGLSSTLNAVNEGSGYVNCTNALTDAWQRVEVVVDPSALTSIALSPNGSITVREGESRVISATGHDLYGNEIDMGGAMWSTNTSGSIEGAGPTANYTAGYIPEVGGIEVTVGDVRASLEVVVINALDGPWLTTIPTQIAAEDSSWILVLATYWHHNDGTSSLRWHAEDVNTSLYSVDHDSTSEAYVSFKTQPDRSGIDVFRLWVRDSNGFSTYQDITVIIQSVNDRPRFVNTPPTELYVKFDTPYSFDYAYYVRDVDTQKSNLRMFSSLPGNVYFDGIIGTFIFGERDGASSYFEIITLTVTDAPEGVPHDSTNSDSLKIVVRVTEDTPPSLSKELPDVELDEGEMDHFAFDLDDYFFDLDNDYLVYTYGFENIDIFIDWVSHEVYMSATTEWSGTMEGTFTAVDPVGALKTDTILVTVFAVNDAPSFRTPGTIHVRYDYAYNLAASMYVSDPDNSIDELAFSFSTPYIEYVSGKLVLLFPASLSGGPFTDPYIVPVTVNVSDPEGGTGVAGFDVMVSDNYPPEISDPVPYYDLVTFLEDEYLDDAISLDVLFHDEDDGGAALNYTVSGNEEVLVAISADFSVNLTASENWSGTEVIELRAIDPHGAWCSWRVTVTVVPVNDAPVVLAIPDFVIRSDGTSIHFDISGYFIDSETPFAGLSVLAIPAPEVVVVGNYLYVDFPQGASDITITIQAIDPDDAESNEVTFSVRLLKTWADTIGYPYTFLIVLMAAGIGGYFLARRMPRPFALDDLFLIHNDGRLISHVTREESTTMDKDVVSAMFTAVQEFVRDSFQAGEVGLKKLEIGDKNVMIKKGNYVYVALIYSGWPPQSTFDKLAMLLSDSEERYRGKIERWNGTKKALPGIDKMLQLYMATGYEPGAWQPEEEGIREEEWVDLISKES